MKFLSNIIPIFISALLATSCVYDNEADLTVSDCDTCNISIDTICVTETESVISYATHVSPILETNCYGCHSAQFASTNGASLEFDDYSEFKLYLGPSFILPQIKHENGATPMPYMRNKLSDCDIETIEAWYNQGALNN